MAAPSYSTHRVSGRPVRCGLVIFFVLTAVYCTSALALAGTVTIVHSNSPAFTGPDVYSDSYLRLQLASGDVTIDTSTAASGADDVYVQDGVVITWTTDNRLTLLAGRNIIISGTIQHDGSSGGLGGVDLAADNDDDGDGDVRIGATGLLTGSAAGSRFGATQIRGVNLILQGGSMADAYAQAGFRALQQGEHYTITGPITIQVDQDVLLTGGVMTNTYAQIGHVGGDVTVTSTLTNTVPVTAAANTLASILITAATS